jgi:carboxymethylenebutenolidase
VTNPNQLKPLHATVLGIFGEEDKGIPPDTVHKFEEAMKDAEKKVEGVHIYKAGHGFMRPTNGPDQKNPVYREEAANDAWKRIEAFFAKTLAEK